MPSGQRQAIVVFEHRPARGPLRWLAPGFRHCFCLLAIAEQGWLVCDPLKGSLHLDVLPNAEGRFLVEHYQRTGRHVAIGLARAMEGEKTGWPTVLTCVELVKRAIGLHAPRAVTPRGLFLELARQSAWTLAYPLRP